MLKVLVIAIILRVLFPLIAFFRNNNFSIFYSQDSKKYVDLATALLVKHEFAYNNLPEIERTPGYPIFLTIGIKFGQLEIITIILQIILSCLTIWLVFKISKIIFTNNKVATLSALLYTIEPLSILYTSKIMPETLFTTFIVLFLYLLLKYFNNKKIPFLFASSFTLAISAYVKPISIYLTIVISIVLAIYVFKDKGKTIHQLFYPVLFLLITIALISPWLVRNLLVAKYNGFSSIGDRTIYVLSTKYRFPHYEGKYKVSKKILTLNPLASKQDLLLQRAKLYELVRKNGLSIITDDIPVYLYNHAKGLTMFLLNPGTTEILRMINFDFIKTKEIVEGYSKAEIIGTLYRMLKENKIGFWIIGFMSVILVSYFLLGILALCCKQTFSLPAMTIIIVIAYLTLLSTYPIGLSRYRHPVMPLISIFSGQGLFIVLDRKTRAYRRIS